MKKSQAQIDVFVTRTFEFRARISDGIRPPQEITVGGKSWEDGVHAEHQPWILYKCARLLAVLNGKLARLDAVPTAAQLSFLEGRVPA